MSYIRAMILVLIVWLVPPFVGGVYYSYTGDHHREQCYLDQAITHLVLLRDRCDPDLQEVVDYTIRRYSRIGSWNVMFFPLWGPDKVLGCNCPWCPGVTLDTSLLMEYTPKEASIILVHEAMHDYPPYFGHSFVTPLEQKLREVICLAR